MKLSQSPLRPFILSVLSALFFNLPAAALDLTSATIADLNTAFAQGTLTAEKLTEFYLARIAAYDKQGPQVNAVITLNPKAREVARSLDAERKAGKVRGPLHGIPIVLKDNYDTFDLPTTAGCWVLRDSIPVDDAFMVKKLRDAGAIIVAKVNLSEFASGGGAPNGFSSMGGQTRNPHDPTRGPSGSSGGTGAAIAAAFAQFGLGTDTSSSIRGPSSANGIVGLRPTLGLLSRDGIIPLALTFDSGGPMARSVYDVAVALGVMTGVDFADAATKISAGKAEKDYTKYLKAGSLKGARIGVARTFFGNTPETLKVMDAAVAKLKELGATVIDPLEVPSYIASVKSTTYSTVRTPEFASQINDYLATLKPGQPRTLAELVARAEAAGPDYKSPWKLANMKESLAAPKLDDPLYLAAKNEGRAFLRTSTAALFAKHKLDAMVYPTSPRPASPIEAGGSGRGAAGGRGDSESSGGGSALNLAPQIGYPDLVVPAGMTSDGLPVTISFLGVPFSEGKLLGYGFDFEQATHARVLPKHTPKISGEFAVTQ